MFEYTINDTKYVATKQEIEDIFIPIIHVRIKNDTMPEGSYCRVGYSDIDIVSFLSYDENSDVIKICSNYTINDPALPSSHHCEDTIIPKEEFVQWYIGSKDNKDEYFAYDKNNMFQKTYNRLKNNIRKSLRKNNFFILSIEKESEISIPIDCPAVVRLNNVPVAYILSSFFNIEYTGFSIIINPRDEYSANSSLNEIFNKKNLPLTTIILQIPDKTNDKAYNFKIDNVYYSDDENIHLLCSFAKYTDKIFKSNKNNNQDIKREFESICKTQKTLKDKFAINIDDLLY